MVKTLLNNSSGEKIYSIATRVFVWGLLLALLYVLRGFFSLIFLTFVFAYIQAHAVVSLEKRLANRTARVVIVGTSFLTIIIAVVVFLAPMIGQQSSILASRLPGYIKSLDQELASLEKEYPLLASFAKVQQATNDESLMHPGGAKWSLNQSRTLLMLQDAFGVGDGAKEGESIRRIVDFVRNVGGQVVAIASAFFLSLLFSFLIVLDLPMLTRRVKHLRYTKLGFIYNEVQNGLKTFATVMGQALEAQLIIAICNTILTALIINYLGLAENLAFLSLIVFICSFVPVAGVFISSVPICVLALIESGFSQVLLAIVGIIFVHTVETYILNPRIFGHRLKLNPVLVLIILTVGGKLFHIWGLILGLPLFTYFFGYAIEYRPELPHKLRRSHSSSSPKN